MNELINSFETNHYFNLEKRLIILINVKLKKKSSVNKIRFY